MRKLISALILLLCLFAPVKRLDVAKLQPVQTVAVYLQGDTVILETDTGDVGCGKDAQKALQDMKAKALTVIYLDTAEYLLVGKGAQEEAEKLGSDLHSSVKVGPYRGGDVEEETAFWEVHGKLPKLDEWNPSKCDKWQ